MDDAVAFFETRITSVFDVLSQELAGVHASRPNPKLIEDVAVQYLGSELAVKQLGTISVQLPREMVIAPWDKGAAGPIAHAIEAAKPGLNSRVDGVVVRVTLPSLTAERREELGRLVKKMAEEARIKIRALRDEANKKTEIDFKTKMVNEDQKFKHKERVQKATDKINEEIEKLLAGKIKEING